MKKYLYAITLAAFAVPAVAERICPESSPFGPCQKTSINGNGDTEVRSESDPFNGDSTWVIQGDRMYNQGDPFNDDKAYSIEKRSDGTTEIRSLSDPFNSDKAWIKDGDRIYNQGDPFNSDKSFRVSD